MQKNIQAITKGVIFVTSLTIKHNVMTMSTIISEKYGKYLSNLQTSLDGKADTIRCYYNDGNTKFASLLIHFTYFSSGIVIDTFIDEVTGKVITLDQMTAMEGTLERFYFMGNQKMRAKLA